MRCVMCNRPLTQAALSIQSANGPLNYGPKCAKSLRPASKMHPARVRISKAPKPAELWWTDPAQSDWVEMLAC